MTPACCPGRCPWWRPWPSSASWNCGRSVAHASGNRLPRRGRELFGERGPVRLSPGGNPRVCHLRPGGGGGPKRRGGLCPAAGGELLRRGGAAHLRVIGGIAAAHCGGNPAPGAPSAGGPAGGYHRRAAGPFPPIPRPSPSATPSWPRCPGRVWCPRPTRPISAQEVAALRGPDPGGHRQHPGGGALRPVRIARRYPDQPDQHHPLPHPLPGGNAPGRPGQGHRGFPGQ